MKTNKLFATLTVALATGGFASTVAAAPIFADLMVLMDESGSMAGEQAWIRPTITSLETGLIAAGIGNGAGSNQYGLIGFGAGLGQAPDPSRVRGFDVGGNGAGNNSETNPGTFGNAGEFDTAAQNLVLTGGFEDGYAAIGLANTLIGRDGAARNYILVTDEDRDTTTSGQWVGLNYANTLESLTSRNILLNAIVNQSFGCGQQTALGVFTGDGGVTRGIIADGSGSYTVCNDTVTFGSGSGSTLVDYVDLALATGGAAWNLNTLRGGGLSADSFTLSFLDVKVQEISEQPTTPSPVPEPGTLALLGLGLAGLGALHRRRRDD